MDRLALIGILALAVGIGILLIAKSQTNTLPYWIEHTYSGAPLAVWIRTPPIPAGGEINIVIEKVPGPEGNAYEVFDAFTDFNDMTDVYVNGIYEFGPNGGLILSDPYITREWATIDIPETNKPVRVRIRFMNDLWYAFYYNNALALVNVLASNQPKNGDVYNNSVQGYTSDYPYTGTRLLQGGAIIASNAQNFGPNNYTWEMWLTVWDDKAETTLATAPYNTQNSVVLNVDLSGYNLASIGVVRDGRGARLGIQSMAAYHYCEGVTYTLIQQDLGKYLLRVVNNGSTDEPYCVVAIPAGELGAVPETLTVYLAKIPTSLGLQIS